MPRHPPAVARVLERVTATARRHEMFAPGDRVLVAVSGGPDSVCLLHGLHLLRRLFRELIRPRRNLALHGIGVRDDALNEVPAESLFRSGDPQSEDRPSVAAARA